MMGHVCQGNGSTCVYLSALPSLIPRFGCLIFRDMCCTCTRVFFRDMPDATVTARLWPAE